MRFLRVMWVVFAKDVRIELRSREIVLTTTVFSLLVTLLTSFSFGLDVLPAAHAAAGSLWISVAFGGILTFQRTFLREKELGVWGALMMTPASKASIYLGKMLGAVFFLTLVELFLMPIVELFFHAPVLERFGSLIPILLLATVGYAAIGTLFSSMMVRTRLRDLLLGIILYPLLAPILIFAVEATKAILLGDSLSEVMGFVTPLITIDLLYLIGGLWLFGPLMED